MAWAGFSEDELRKLQLNDGRRKPNQQDDAASGNGTSSRKFDSAAKRRPQRAVPPMKKQQPPDNAEPLLNTARLSQAVPPPQDSKNSNLPQSSHSDSSAAVGQSNETPSDSQRPNSLETSQSASVNQLSSATPSVEAEAGGKARDLLDDTDGRSRDLMSLEQYQQQQKMMEELNKKKKQMLAQALAERTKQASAEANKLKTIQRELSHLDQRLNLDVSVIRDRIEEATKDYTEASKRYEAAEKEYIEAKINLHKKSEMKEQLTEHLYAIIHQNEIRKAKKLAELMEQLDMTSESDNSSNLPTLPSYSLLGSLQTVGSGNLKGKTVTSPITPPPASTLAQAGPEQALTTSDIPKSTDSKPEDSHEPDATQSEIVSP